MTRFLIDQEGIAPAYLSVLGYGEYRPLFPNDTVEHGRRIAGLTSSSCIRRARGSRRGHEHEHTLSRERRQVNKKKILMIAGAALPALIIVGAIAFSTHFFTRPMLRGHIGGQRRLKRRTRLHSPS